MSIEVTLLSKDEVKEKSKVLQKVGRGCNKWYWTSTSSLFNSWNSAGEFLVDSFEALDSVYVNYNYGVRPVLKSDNLDELINGLNSKTENGVQIVEYGEFPDLSKEIEVSNPSYLRKTGKEYILPDQTILSKLDKFNIYKYPEYKYNEKKYIKIGDLFYEVKPIEFYVDRENHMLISKKVLFSSPINIDNSNYNRNFKTS